MATVTNWADLEKQVWGATFEIGTETAGDAVTVGVQLLDRDGKAAKWVASLPFYLSSDAAGTTPVAIPTSITAGTDGGVFCVVAATGGMLVTEATGQVDIVITGDTGADTVYLNVVLPTGAIVTSDAVVILAD